jgi:hypothetical protein
VNWDQPTTEFMKAEFGFITQTSLPSIEFDVCKDIEKFKSMLEKKLGKKETKEGTELSFF